MKYGVYFAYWEDSWDVDFEKYVRKVKKLGLDILEVAALGLVNLPEQKLERLKQLAEQHDIILTAGIGLPKEYDVSSTDKTVRRNGITFVKKVMDAMHQAGIHRIGGTVYSYWPVDYSGPFDKPAARKHSIESVRELAEYARQYNITLLIETLNRFEQFLLNDAEEAVAYVKEVNKPNVKVMLDTFHMNIEEDHIADAIRYTGDHLGQLHIGEANRKVPGKGSMPWTEIGQALKDIRYDGYVVMEPFVKTGGQVGRDIKLWRDLSGNATEEQLDRELAESLEFVKAAFGE
ncbi:sugar phosphate isomerase/epimerase family protein [Kroppenstedtia eburnea]|uniref:D-tagatose 3-epimerase n=1 Tax=Kroppenstedtia eburnea TaxID=714067 RepID=A0A1N7MFN7_9BACL|nr:sugar phosphate isomerase/epimerase family protein [Kroppenstedtia eburnea]QKI81542.1 sugar phosphate isomerase/epimerase [Kroppenstedtia eburnea]SIS84858.1 D-tagatose 3-epimerase [Kroppenstedtia eburnea]